MKNDEYLEHYASPYYDPVKAHEYYMRTRQLKGRRSTAKLSDEGKKVWAYTKNSISEEKKAKTEKARNKRDAKIQKHREKAKQTRERITKKLKQLNERLSSDSKRSREILSVEKQGQIEKIRERYAAPKGASKATRAHLAAQRDAEIAKVRNAAAKQQNKLNEATNKQHSENSKSAGAQRQEVATNLRNVVAATRAAYKQSKIELDQTYENIYQQEFDKIAAEYAKPVKRRRKSK